MAREPTDRFPSCVAFMQALEAALRPEPKPMVRPRSSQSTIYLLGAVLGVLLIGGILFVAGVFDTTETVAPEEEDSIRLVLLSKGSEPRRLLRYAVETGKVDRVVLRTSRRIQRVVEGKLVDFMPAPAVIMEGDVRYVEPDRPGEIAFEWTMVRAAADETEGFDQKQVDEMNKHLGPLRGTRAIGRTSIRGTHSSADIESTGEATSDVWGYSEILANSMKQFALPLPSEEVGVGARWEVTAVEDLFDLRLAATTTYEIVGFEGELVRLRFNMGQVAHRQPFSPPGLPAQFKSEVIRLNGDGSGSALVDLTSLVSKFEADVDSNMTMRIYTDKDGVETTVETSELVVKSLVFTERR